MQPEIAAIPEMWHEKHAILDRLNQVSGNKCLECGRKEVWWFVVLWENGGGKVRVLKRFYVQTDERVSNGIPPAAHVLETRYAFATGGSTVLWAVD